MTHHDAGYMPPKVYECCIPFLMSSVFGWNWNMEWWMAIIVCECRHPGMGTGIRKWKNLGEETNIIIGWKEQIKFHMVKNKNLFFECST